MDFIRSTSEKVKLWRVEHFFPPFFSRSMLIGGKFIFYKKIHYKICKCCNFNQSALTWKKTGEKSVQLVRVSLFRKYFLWNPYFSICLQSWIRAISVDESWRLRDSNSVHDQWLVLLWIFPPIHIDGDCLSQ